MIVLTALFILSIGVLIGYLIGIAIAKRVYIYRACEWMKINYGHFDGSIEDLVVDFRKAMEE